jgi:hypothetical protein
MAHLRTTWKPITAQGTSEPTESCIGGEEQMVASGLESLLDRDIPCLGRAPISFEDNMFHERMPELVPAWACVIDQEYAFEL